MTSRMSPEALTRLNQYRQSSGEFGNQPHGAPPVLETTPQPSADSFAEVCDQPGAEVHVGPRAVVSASDSIDGPVLELRVRNRPAATITFDSENDRYVLGEAHVDDRYRRVWETVGVFASKDEAVAELRARFAAHLDS